MAITKTREIHSINAVFHGPEVGDEPVIILRYEDVWDDPDDADLPVRKPGSETIYKYQPADAVDPDAERVATDLSGYDQRVQDIAAIIWA